MIDLVQFGNKVATLRKERGYTGEGLAERLHVSPQAISKWENGKCLPESAVLPALSQALQCSIDSLLCPQELFILEAVYTDGQTRIPVTRFLNDMVRDNVLNIYVNAPFIPVGNELSDRLKLLTVKFQTPKGIYFTYALQNENLILDKESSGKWGELAGDAQLRVIGAYYGNEKRFSSAMQKMEHYEYFKWDEIAVNHENFPSNTASDDTEYLTLIYLNVDGIHAISCPENQTIYYGNCRTQLFLRDDSKCILKNVIRLSWEEGMDCPWAGALYGALKYMGEDYSYHQIMGMSGACYRLCFTDVWDFSCTDALVAFDYATLLFKAIGYSFRWADRVEKQERKAERLAIMEDIRRGKPVLAINLRIAPEWGIITGYTEQGSQFLCRTYFDREVFDALEGENCPSPEDRRIVFEENDGYLFNDFWPFLVLHFGEKTDKPSPLDTLKKSLEILVDSFYAEQNRGYNQGKGAYMAWMEGLSKEEDFQLESDRENVLRRLSVNDHMLCCLIDARQAAASYLRENSLLVTGKEQEYLAEIAENCQMIADMVSAFREQVKRQSSCEIAYNGINAFGVAESGLRKEQIKVLEKAMELDERNCGLAKFVFNVVGIEGRPLK